MYQDLIKYLETKANFGYVVNDKMVIIQENRK